MSWLINFQRDRSKQNIYRVCIFLRSHIPVTAATTSVRVSSNTIAIINVIVLSE